MKCYRKNGSDVTRQFHLKLGCEPSMKCYRKNGSDSSCSRAALPAATLNEVLPKER